MNVTQIPFVETVGVKRNEQGVLGLALSEGVQNHLKTIHACAQFTLAETASGEILQTTFPELVGKVIPVLRVSQIKYKNPATKSIIAVPSVSSESIQKFNDQFSKKGRASISVDVEIKDIENTVTCVGKFNWFIQSIK